MKNFRKILLAICIMGTSIPAFSTLLTVYKVKDACRYIVVDNNNKPVASWYAPFSPELSHLKSVKIVKHSELWKMLKKMAPQAKLNSVYVNYITDQSLIAHWELMDIPRIPIDHFTTGKDFKPAGTSNEMAAAQDYNSSRSNKANSIATNPLYDGHHTSGSNPMYENKNGLRTGDNNDSLINTNSIANAQDYNSSRSNKANSISTAQDYNSSRSNKANSIAPAQDYNSSRSNKANSIATAPDNNSSINNKPNSISTAQDYNSSRSNKNSIIISTGFASGNKESTVAKGFLFNINYQVPLSSILNIEAGAIYFLNDFDYSPSNVLPEEYLINLKENEQNKKWNSLAITVGPSVNIGRNSLYATVYAQAGILFIKTKQRFIGGAKGNSEVTDASGVAKFSGNYTGAAFNMGIRIHYKISHRVALFIAPYFFTSLKKDITYSEKDASLSIDADGNFNKDLFAKLPYLPKRSALENYGIQLGIKISCF